MIKKQERFIVKITRKILNKKIIKESMYKNIKSSLETSFQGFIREYQCIFGKQKITEFPNRKPVIIKNDKIVANILWYLV